MDFLVLEIKTLLLRPKILRPNCCLGLLGILACVCLMPSFLQGQDLAKDAIDDRSLPWYSNQDDDIQPLVLPKREEAASKDRDSVELAPKRNTNAAGRGWSSPGFGLSAVAWLAVTILIALLFGLLLYAFFRLESKTRKKNEDQIGQRSLEESIRQLPFQMAQSTGDLRHLAEQAYKAGNYRQAVIFLFSHVLVTLDQNELIRLRKGKTNRQYLQELRTSRTISDFYQQVMVPFEATFFGDHPVSKDEFESCWFELDGFHDLVDQSTQAGIA